MDFSLARQNMIDGQLRPNRVSDPTVLAAVASVPREQFLPAQLRPIAYVDEDIPLAKGRHLVEPLVLARLLQWAAVKSTDRALDIGCATGYSTALLARLAREVVGVECDAELAGQATAHLQALGIGNAQVVTGKLAEGHAIGAPYDIILIGGGIEQVPAALQAQLAEGGRLITVVRNGPAGTARLMQKVAGAVSSRPLFDAASPLLPGFERSASFAF